MKKILKLSLILVIMLFIANSTSYAAMKCDRELVASKSTGLNLNDEITIKLDISNVVSQNGLVALGAVLEYPKNSLELIGTPNGEGIGFNKANNKILVTRTNPIKGNETVFTLTFKVISTEAKNFNVTLNNIEAGDGSGSPTYIESVSAPLSINEDRPNPTPTPNPTSTPGGEDPTGTPTPTPGGEDPTGTPTPTPGGEDPTGTPTPTPGDDNKPNITDKPGQDDKLTGTDDDTTKKEPLPKTGFNHMLIPCVILTIAVIGGALYIKVKILDKRMK